MDESLQFASAYSNLLNLHNISEQVANAMERHKRLQDIPRPAKTTNGAIRFTSSRQDDGGDLRRDLHATRRFSAHCAPDAGVATIDSQILRKSERVCSNSNADCRYLTLPRCWTRFVPKAAAAWRTDEPAGLQTAGRDARRFDVLSTNHLGRWPHLYVASIPPLGAGMSATPLTRSIVTFGSWMGGDREVIPTSPPSTRDVVLLARIQGVNLLLSDSTLIFDLSMWRTTTPAMPAKEILAASESDKTAIFEERKRRNYDDFWKAIPEYEPYRVILAEL